MLALCFVHPEGLAAPADAPSPESYPDLPARLQQAEPANLIRPATKPKLLSHLEGEQARLEALPSAAPSLAVHRIENPERHRNHYAVEVRFLANSGFAKGHAYLARFWVRTVFAKHESGEGTFSFYVQQSSEPWHKLVQVRISVGSAWQLIEIPFVADMNLEAGTAAAMFSFAYFNQSLEFTTPAVLDFGTRVGLADLPRTRFTYAGREPDAPWRAEALARIEELRTAPLDVLVQDAAGQPVPGIRVEAKLTRPEFLFGSEIDTAWIVKDTPDARRYREMSLELFDIFTPGSGLKWHRWFYPKAGPGVLWPRDETLRALEWLHDQGVPVKGHVLVWGGWGFTPREVRSLPDREKQLPGLIDGFLADVLAATGDRLAIWDVLNEPINEPDYLNLLGEETAAGWFKTARKLAPSAQLFINDYRMLTGADSRPTIEKYLGLIARLRQHGAPIDGIGIQGHFGQQVPHIATIAAEMDLLASAGLPLHITEFDINTDDEQLQADFTRDFLILCYSHPAFTGFFNWGFWEGSHWIPQAAMVRKDWTFKPNGRIWRDLVHGQWRTRIDQTTAADGRVSARGHLGTYEISVTAPDGRTVRTTHRHARGSDRAVVQLPAESQP